jgi:hypothetical protein
VNRSTSCNQVTRVVSEYKSPLRTNLYLQNVCRSPQIWIQESRNHLSVKQGRSPRRIRFPIGIPESKSSLKDTFKSAVATLLATVCRCSKEPKRAPSSRLYQSAKPVRSPVQDLDADAVATQKDKEVARKWVGVEEGFHQNGQGINGLAHVCSDH